MAKNEIEDVLTLMQEPSPFTPQVLKAGGIQ